MKIGIIGSGIVGRVLATAFLTEGHQVMIGTRDPQKEDVVKWTKKNPSGKAGLFAEAAAFGDLLVLAVAGIAAEQAVQESGLENFRGKTVIDVTNPIAKEPPVNGVLSFFTDGHTSLMEKLQALLPDAHLVKAFNSVGNAQMYKPQYTEGKPTMFICGNDDGARKTVTEILTAFGWDTEDMGKAEAARAIEPLCILWCIPGFLYNRWTHAFKLLKS